MSRCVIMGAYGGCNARNVVGVDDFVICADGGYLCAVEEGIRPDLVIGDFDSFNGRVAAGIETERVPSEKNDTDTMLCLKRGMELGYDQFLILGGIGGRLDHTVANLQTLAYGCDMGCFVLLTDSQNIATVIEKAMLVPKLTGYKLSLFAFDGVCTGVTVTGVKYPLSNATLTPNFPLGVSNEFEADEAVIECKKGKLLLILSKD